MRRTAAALGMVAFASAFASAAPAAGAPSTDRLQRGWQMAWEPDVTALAPPERIPSLTFEAAEKLNWPRQQSDPSVLWLKIDVDTRGLPSPVLFVPKAFVCMSAYVDGRLVSRMDDYDDASGTPIYVVPLPSETDQVQVTLRLFSYYTKAGLPEGAYLGTFPALISQTLRRDAVRIALSSLFFFIGLVALVVAPRSRFRRALFFLALHALSLALWTTFHVRAKSLVVEDTSLFFTTWWLAVPLIPLGFAGAIRELYVPGERGVLRGVVLAFVGVVVLAALALLLEPPYGAVGFFVFVVVRAGTLLLSVTAAVWILWASLLKRRLPRMIAAAIGLTALCAVHDVGLSLRWFSGTETFTHFGYTLTALTLVLALRQRVVAMEHENERYRARQDDYIRERDHMVRDLHDGLGGLLTNLRLLADRASKPGAADKQARVLGQIASVSTEAVNELRTLISGFDQLPSTWPEVAAELRARAAKRCDGHDVLLEVHTHFGNAAPPNPLVFVHLLRITQEAITNAVKHAGAGRIVMAFRVDDAGLELAVTDHRPGPGAGPDQAGPAGGDGAGDRSSGVGLRSMKKRASALGGELTFLPHEAGSALRLVVPLSPAVDDGAAPAAD